jgi:hypothetical protein
MKIARARSGITLGSVEGELGADLTELGGGVFGFDVLEK